VRQQALQLAARAVERRLNADRGDGAVPTLPCSCGQRARYGGRRSKRFETVLGVLTLKRAYYSCAACGRGFCPRDQTLGLVAGSLSPGVLHMVAQVGALVSFQEGSQLLAALAGVTVDAKHVERAAEALGVQIADDEQRRVEPPPTAELPKTLYLGMDGTGIPMRSSELLGRPGKQTDGSAKTREAKLCAVWSAERRDDQGRAVRDTGSISYSAAIESAAIHDTDDDYPAFAQRVVREAKRRGFERAKRQVILGDGALWIWNLAGEHFPQAIQIVDRFHAKQHLSQAAKAIWGPDSELGREWPLSATPSSTTVSSAPSSRLCGSTLPPNPKPAAASATSGATDAACATPTSTAADCALLRGSSKPAAKSSSPPGSSAPACTGPSAVPTPSSLCAAPSSAAAWMPSGRAY
jgi:hypothetical protein